MEEKHVCLKTAWDLIGTSCSSSVIWSTELSVVFADADFHQRFNTVALCDCRMSPWKIEYFYSTVFNSIICCSNWTFRIVFPVFSVWTSEHCLRFFLLLKISNSLLTCAFICIYCDISCEIMWHTCPLCTWIPAAEVKSVPVFKHVNQHGPSSSPAVAPTSVNKPQSWMDLRSLKDIFLFPVKICFLCWALFVTRGYIYYLFTSDSKPYIFFTEFRFFFNKSFYSQNSQC